MFSSVSVFVGSPERTKKPVSAKQHIKQLFVIDLYDVLFRIVASFVPPVGKLYQKVYVDLLGPSIAVLILTVFLTYGNSLKHVKTSFSPVVSVFGFLLLMPIFSYVLTRLGKSSVNFCETLCLIGYAFYGHMVTLLVSFVCFQEDSNFFFFVCLIIFGGLSTLRLGLIFLGTISVPAARLLVCTPICVANILFTMFLHFSFMHRSFVYIGEK